MKGEDKHDACFSSIASFLFPRKYTCNLLQRWSDGNQKPGGMKILLNKLKAGRCGKLSRIRCYSLTPRCLHALCTQTRSFCVQRGEKPQPVWLRPQRERGLGEKLTVCLLKDAPLPLAVTPLISAGSADRGYLNKLESTFGKCQFRSGSRETRSS